MIVEINDGEASKKCVIKINGERVLNCIRYEIVHDAAHGSPKVILYLTPTEISFKGTMEDLVLERKGE